MSLIGSLIDRVFNKLGYRKTRLISHEHSEATRRGLENAKASGKKSGRPPKTTAAQRLEVISKRAAGVTISQLSRDYGVSRATIHSILKSGAGLVEAVIEPATPVEPAAPAASPVVKEEQWMTAAQYIALKRLTKAFSARLLSRECGDICIKKGIARNIVYFGARQCDSAFTYPISVLEDGVLSLVAACGYKMGYDDNEVFRRMKKMAQLLNPSPQAISHS